MKNKIVAKLGDCFYLDVKSDYSYWLMLTCARWHRNLNEIEYTFTIIARSLSGDLTHFVGNTWIPRVKANKEGITAEQFEELLSLRFNNKMIGRELEVLATRCHVHQIFTNFVKESEAHNELIYKRALKIAIDELGSGCPHGSIPCVTCEYGYIKKTIGDCWLQHFKNLAKEEMNND